jgi:hypothetical protein
MYYIVDKLTWKVIGYAPLMDMVRGYMASQHKTDKDVLILEDIQMDYIPKIIYVDGKPVYNNIKFWREDANNIIADYENHDIRDFVGHHVALNQFMKEQAVVENYAAALDGTKANEALYNMRVGKEFLGLFQEEYSNAEISSATEALIASKTAAILSFLLIGNIKMAIAMFDTLETDEFLTEQRIAKYRNMLTAANAFEYAKE